jgi:hypothetical protein
VDSLLLLLVQFEKLYNMHPVNMIESHEEQNHRELMLMPLLFTSFDNSIHATAMSSQIAARSCSGITAADNAALVSFQKSYNLEGEFPKH